MEKRKINNKFEVHFNNFEQRAYETDGKKYIEGYAAIFDTRSKLIYDWAGKYYEIIERGAFDEVLESDKLDVIYTPNHDYDKVVARTKSGTLKLEVDERGLKYIAEVPENISYANDIYQSIKRGDTYESSFTFSVDENGQTWSEDENGMDIRTIHKVKHLREVASVTWGAYATTDVEARGRKEYIERKQKEKQPEGVPLDVYKKKLYLKNLKR